MAKNKHLVFMGTATGISVFRKLKFRILFLCLLATASPVLFALAAEDSVASEPYGIEQLTNDLPTVNTVGDIDHNGSIDLSDAVLALRITLGFKDQAAPIDADVNGDGQIGIPEAIYVLQILAGYRDWDAELPTVMATNPAHQAIDVFKDTPVTVEFSEPLEPSSVNVDTCRFERQDGSPIPGVLTLDQEVITFTPSVPFSFDTQYTVILKAGIQDLDGSAMPNDYIFTFRTLALPTVLTTDPIPGTDNVLVDGSVSISFNQLIDPATVDAATFAVTRDGEQVAGILEVTGNTITFTPSAPLDFDTPYTVTLKAGIRDMNGNSMPGDYSFPFKTVAPQPVSVSVLDASVTGVELRLDPPVPGLLPADIGVSADGESFVSSEAVSTTDNGATYTVTIPLDACGTYMLRLDKWGYAFGGDVPVLPTAAVNATVSQIGISGFTLSLEPPIPQLTAQEVWLAAQGTSETHPAGAIETKDNGETYRVYFPLAHGETYLLDIHNDCYQINTPPVIQVPEPTLTGTIANVSYDRNLEHYEFDIRTDIRISNMHYTLVPEDIVVLDEDGIPVAVSEFEVIVWNSQYIAFSVTADLRHGMTHMVDLYAPDAPYIFAGAEITTERVVTFEVADAWLGSFTIVTDLPLTGLSPDNVEVEMGPYPYTPLQIESVTTSSDSRTHTIYAPVDLHTPYTVRLVMPGHSFYPATAGSDEFSLEERYIEITAADVTLDGFTLVPDKSVEGLTIDEFELINLDGPNPVVDSLTTGDNGASYRISAQLNILNRYTVGFERYGYHVVPGQIFITPQPPAAVDDAPGPSASYTTLNDADLSVTVESGLLSNDVLGIPDASLTRFGGGSLGGVVTNTPAGATVSLAGGILLVNGDGSFSLSGQPFTPGTYTFDYRIANDAGTSDATVTLQIQQRPAVLSTSPAPDTQGAALNEVIRILFNNVIDPATIDASSLEVTRDGEPVDGTIEVIDNEIVFTPAAPFALDSLYTVVLKTGIQDLNGNRMTGDYDFTFRSAGPPALLSTDPAPGSGNVTVDRVVTLSFNNEIDPSTVHAATFQVFEEGEPVEGTIEVIDTTITFTPSAPLDCDRLYTVVLNADIQDMNGTSMPEYYLFNFRTVALPLVLTNEPAPGAENAFVDGSIRISFNNFIDPATVDAASFAIAREGVPVAGTIAVIDNAITFTPSTPLDFAALYTVILKTGITDIFGNGLPDDHTFTFTTAALPAVLTTDPAPDADNVRVDRPVSISFNNSIDPATVDAASLAITRGGELVDGSIACVDNAITFTPSALLVFDTLYTVVLKAGIRDIFGTPLPEDYGFTFRTVIQPEVITSVPTPNAEDVAVDEVVRVTLNNRVDPTTIDPSTFEIIRDGVPFAGTIEVIDHTITFTPSEALAFDTEHAVTVKAGVKDVNGTPLPGDYSFTFRTVSRPTVITADPAPGTGNVLVDRVISVTFSKAIDPATVNAASFWVTGDDGPVGGTITVADTTITFTPSAPLEVETLYTVTLKADIEDMNGNSMSGDYFFPLRTAALQQVSVSERYADVSGIELRLDPPVPGLLPADIGISADGTTFVSPQAVSTPDNGETYTVTMPLDAGGTYHLRLDKPGYNFGNDVQIVPMAVVTVSRIGVSGFMLTLDPPLPNLTAQEVWLEAQGTSDPQPAGALETADGGATYRVYFPLVPEEIYTLDIRNDSYPFTAHPAIQVPEPTLTGTITDVNWLWDLDSSTGRYEFDLRINTNPPNWTYNLQPDDMTILDEDGIPVPVSECAIDPNYNAEYQAFTVTADLKRGMTHLVDVYAPHVPYTFAGAEIKLASFDVENAVFGEFTIATDVPVPELSPANIDLREGYTPVAVQSVSTSNDGYTHIVKAPVDVGVDYQVSLVLPGFHVDPGIIVFRTYERLITFTVSDAVPNGFTLALDSPVEGLTSAELKLTNLDGPDPAVESLTTDDGGRTYHFFTLLTPGYRYEVTLEKYGYQSIPKDFSIDPQLPKAVDDAPGLSVGYSTLLDADLSVAAGPGLLNNDFPGAPAASLTSFGGGSLGGAVTDHAAGTSVSLAGDTLQVNGDGSFSLTGQPLTPGTYTFDYRIGNGVGTSDATVTIQVQQLPAVLSTTPAPDAQSVALHEAIRISFSNPIDPATVDASSLAITRNGETVDGTIDVIDNEIIFTPSVPFALDALYTVVLKTGIQDMNGNSMTGDYSFTFRSAALPAVVSATPAPGTENALVDGAVRISFNNPIDPATVDISSLEVMRSGEPVAGIVDVIDNEIIFTPSALFDFVTTYTVVLKAGVQDKNGNSISSDYSFTFKTAALQLLSLSVLDATVNGLALSLNPPVPGLLPANVGISADGAAFVPPQAVSTTDDGATYTVTIPLDAGGMYLLRLDKPGYEFDTYVSIEPGAVVNAMVSDIGVSGFTLALDPPLPYLEAQEIWLNTQGTADTQPATALETTDGGATYRVYSPLTPGETYTLGISSDRYQLDIPPTIQMPTPTLTGTLTEEFPDDGVYRLRLDTGSIQPGDDHWWDSLGPGDITLLDGKGLPVPVSSVYVIDGGYTGANYVMLRVIADLEDGTTHLVDVHAPGETFGGVEATTTQKVKLDADPTNAAVVGEFTFHTDFPLPELSPDNIDLKQSYSPHTPVAVQSVSTSMDGRTHVVSAPIRLETWYKATLVGIPGYRFDNEIYIRPYPRFIKVDVQDETPYGFTLVLNPAFDGLTTADFCLTNLDGPAPTVESFTTEDGGYTYHVTTSPRKNYNRYMFTLEAYGYIFQSRSVYFDVIDVHPTTVENARHDGFTLVFSHPVDGLTPANLTLTSEVTSEQVPVASVATSDGGWTYQVDAGLIPGHPYRIDIERPGYLIGYQLIYPPEADLAVSDLTRDGFTLSLSPPVPGLVPGDLVIGGRIGDNDFTLPVTAATTTDGGATYTVEVSVLEDSNLHLEIPVIGHTARYVGRTYFYLARRISWSINEVFPDRLALQFSYPVKYLKPNEVVLVDTQGVEWHADSVMAVNDEESAYTVGFDVPVGQTYSVDVRAVRTAPYDWGQEDPYWQFVGPPPDIEVQNWVVVDVSVSEVTATEVALAITPAVAGLSSENIEIISVVDKSPVVTAISTANDGATYTLSAAYTPGNAYAIRLERPGYRFGLPLAFSIGTPPVLTGAWTDAEGTAIVLRFNKDMAEPPDTPAGFTLTENGAPQTILNVARSTADTRRLRLHLGQALGTGALALSYAPAAVASTDAGPLEAIEEIPVPNQNTVLGTAFALALQEHAVVELAATLVTRFALDADGLLPPLLALGYGPSQLAEALSTALLLDADQVAARLAGEGYDTRTITKSLLDIHQDDPATVVSALTGIGSDAPGVAAELRWAFRTDGAESAALLRDAGFELVAITDALRIAYNNSLWGAVYDLKLAGFDTLNIAVALCEAYNLSQSDITVAATALREAGIGAAEVATTMVAFEAQEDTPAAVGRTLADAGFSASSVAEALETVYGKTGGVLSASMEAGLSLLHAKMRLRDVWGVNAADAYNILLDAGLSGEDAIMAVFTINELNDVVAVARIKGWSAVDIYKSMLAFGYIYHRENVEALSQAGYSIDDAAPALRSVERASGNLAGHLLNEVYGATPAEIASAMREAGYEAIEVAEGLYQTPFIYYVDAYSVIARALRDAGFSLDEVAIGMAGAGIDNTGIAEGLLGAGVLEVTEVVQGLRVTGMRFEPDMISALCAAGYPVLAVLEAWIDQTDATPGNVVELRHHQGVCHYCNLPSWHGEDTAAVWIDHLQTLFPPVDAAEARAMTLDALRKGGFSADFAAWGVRMKLVDPGAAVMLRDLLNAGYGSKKALDALRFNYGLYDYENLISLALDAGLTPIDAADYLSGNMVYVVVSILAQAGLSAEDVAFVLRQYYRTTAAEALAYLDRAGCPHSDCYTSAEVTSAVETVFNIADPLVLIARQMHTNGEDPQFAAMHLRDRFGLDITGTATAMRDGGFLRDEVMYGVYYAFLEWNVSRVWDQPETHQALRQVLQDVYGVTNTLEQLNGVLDVAKVTRHSPVDWDPIGDALVILHQGPYPLTEIVLVLQDLIPYDSQVFTDNRVQMLDYLFNTRSITDYDYGYAAIRAAVASVYGAIDLRTEAACWAKLKKLSGTSAREVAYMLRERFQAGGDQPVETAFALHDAGWSQDAVLSAVADAYYRTYYQDRDRAALHALLLKDVYQTSDIQDLANELLYLKHYVSNVDSTLRAEFPAASRGEIINSLRNAGVSEGELEKLVDGWIGDDKKDDTVADILPTVITSPHRANILLYSMGYSLEERLSRLTDPDGFAFPPHVVMGSISDDINVMVSKFYAVGTPARQVAEGIRRYWSDSTAVSTVAEILWKEGYTRQEIVYALAPPNIAFPPDGQVPEGQYPGVSTGDLFLAVKWLIDGGAFTAADIVRDLNSIKPDMDLFQLVSGVYDGLGAMEAYRTVNGLQDLLQWHAVGTRFSHVHLNPELVALHVVKQFGEDASFAARRTLAFCTSDPSDWTALVFESQSYLVDAGYDWHESYWASYDAHGLNDPVWGDVLTITKQNKDPFWDKIMFDYVGGF